MTKSSFEKRNTRNNFLINNSTNNAEIIHNILEIKPIKKKIFPNENKNRHWEKKENFI